MNCKWNHLNGKICSRPLDVDSRAWCCDHKALADKVWEKRDPRSVEYEKKKNAIPTVQPSDQYL